MAERLDRADAAKKMIEVGLSPQDVANIPLPQLHGIFGEPDGWHNGSMTAAKQLEIQNRMRAKKGLPPVQSRRKKRGRKQSGSVPESD